MTTAIPAMSCPVRCLFEVLSSFFRNQRDRPVSKTDQEEQKKEDEPLKQLEKGLKGLFKK
jgi:hypothetical protein